MDKTGVVPIVEKFLLPNYLMAIRFREGWLFGRTVDRRICQYKPYPLIDATGADVDIPASGHQSELRFRDPRNPDVDILYLRTTTNAGFPWILYGSIGIKPQWIRMYPRFPEGKEIPGKFPEIDPISPAAGDKTGYVSALESPYDEPTDWVEFVIVPLQHLGAEYYNFDDRAHQPVLNLLFEVIWFQVFKPDLERVGPFNDLIRGIALRKVPAAFLRAGYGDMPLDLGATLRKDWKAVPISLDEAIRLPVR